MRCERLLLLLAALALAAPAEAAPGHIIWVEVCDAAHPGRRMPLPLGDDRGPPQACHAACGVMPGRRTAERRP